MFVLSGLKKRWQNLKVPETKGKYAKEFYYAKRVDYFLLIWWPVLLIWQFFAALNFAWHHSWVLLWSLAQALFWFGWWMVRMTRRYTRRDG